MDVACFCEPEQYDVKKDEISKMLQNGNYPDTNNPLNRMEGEYGLCYKKDNDGNVIFPDTSKASVYEGTYFAHTENEITNGDSKEKVAGTTAVINDSTMQLQVSKKSGPESDTYPLVRKATDEAERFLYELTYFCYRRFSIVGSRLFVVRHG